MSKKRGPYSSPLQQKRRRRILRTAGLLLERHGLATLTMQSIAEASEVSTKTLYNLFGSRDMLLLEAAGSQLDNLEHSNRVERSEAGIPRLLSYTEGAMQGFEHTPEYARTVIAILIRAELDPDSANARFGRMQRFAHSCLSVAQEQGELRPGLDLLELSTLISGNQWGIALLWEKGVIELEQLESQTTLSHYLTLISICRGQRKRWLEEKLEQWQLSAAGVVDGSEGSRNAAPIPIRLVSRTDSAK